MRCSTRVPGSCRSIRGHFPPVIATAGQTGTLAELAVDPPIGVADTRRLQLTTLALDPGAVLCFFTDGLVERRDRRIDDGILQLCEAVQSGPPEDICNSAMQALVGSQHPGDDIAILVARWQRGQTPARLCVADDRVARVTPPGLRAHRYAPTSGDACLQRHIRDVTTRHVVSSRLASHAMTSLS